MLDLFAEDAGHPAAFNLQLDSTCINDNFAIQPPVLHNRARRVEWLPARICNDRRNGTLGLIVPQARVINCHRRDIAAAPQRQDDQSQNAAVSGRP